MRMMMALALSLFLIACESDTEHTPVTKIDFQRARGDSHNTKGINFVGGNFLEVDNSVFPGHGSQKAWHLQLGDARHFTSKQRFSLQELGIVIQPDGYIIFEEPILQLIINMKGVRGADGLIILRDSENNVTHIYEVRGLDRHNIHRLQFTVLKPKTDEILVEDDPNKVIDLFLIFERAISKAEFYKGLGVDRNRAAISVNKESAKRDKKGNLIMEGVLSAIAGPIYGIIIQEVILSKELKKQTNKDNFWIIYDIEAVK